MVDGSSNKLSVKINSSDFNKTFLSLAITKHNDARTHNCAEKALVEATPISGPAAIESTKSDSLAMLLSITFTRLKTLHLFFLTNFKAARVSAVSPDCEIKITKVSLGLSTKGLYLYSEAR